MALEHDPRFIRLVRGTRSFLAERLGQMRLPDDTIDAAAHLAPGKMLRTRLAARLACAAEVSAEERVLMCACAAAEMAHTGSLCHDDLIDGALTRRGRAAIWRVSSPAQAVLTGDLLLCEAMDLVLETEQPRLVQAFVAKLRETCAAEAEHDLVMRHRAADAETCLRIARGKTGPLFAFPLCALSPDEPRLNRALVQAGYLVGALYQLADDLLDVAGSEAASGKTLGTDHKRGKPTLANLPGETPESIRRRMAHCSEEALGMLRPWPSAGDALEAFLSQDLQPIFESQIPAADAVARVAV